MNDHLHWVDHGVINPHTGVTEYRCRCQKVMCTLDDNGQTIWARRGYEAYAKRVTITTEEQS